MNKEILNTSEVADLLHAEPSTVANLAMRGELRATSIGKSYIFFRDDVLQYVREKVEFDTAKRRAKRNLQAAGIVAEIMHPERCQRGPKARPLPVLPPVPKRQAA